MIVATAGHIDHGKTLLIKALTGTDTDRLPEEKARGISIDLGFAYLPIPGGHLIGFVDVPGHERFVRNMLAGVSGIDFALLVVAADDGVMQQTVEHLNILNLLNIARGCAVISKIDRVSKRRVHEVAEDVKALLAKTRLAASPVLPVSARTNSGVPELRKLLTDEAAALVTREPSGQYFRFAVDRAFVVVGSGTVVTGTVFNGIVIVNDRLVVSGRGTEVRVRGIQIHGAPADRAVAAQRCALNLSGADLESVSRGDWVLDSGIHNSTRRLDVRISLLDAEAGPLKHWTPVHVHLASADVMGRVAVRGGGLIAPGTSELAQLVLDHPIDALHGDRFIVRDQSAGRTLGGGSVLDPFATPIRRRDSPRLAQLAALEQSTPEAALTELLRISDNGIDLARFEKTFNLTPDRAHAMYAKADIVQLGKETRFGIAPIRHRALRQRIVEGLAQFHLVQPRAIGQNVEALRRAMAVGLAPDAFQSLLRELGDARRLEIAGSNVRLPGHDATSNPADEKLWHIVLPALEATGFMPPSVRHLAAQLALNEAVLTDFLHRKAISGEVVKVAADRFYPRSTVATLAAIAQDTARSSSDGLFTVAQYRDATGASRRAVIKVLEFLDALGITQRLGDTREIQRDFVPIFGAATVPAMRPPSDVANAPCRERVIT